MATLLLGMVLFLAGYTIGLTRPAVEFLAGSEHGPTVTAVAHWSWAAAVFTAVGGFCWWVTYWLILPTTTTFAWIERRDDEADHAGGVATRLDIAQYASKAALRKRATVVRPSLAQVSWWRRRFRTPATEYGFKLLTAGMVNVTSQVWGSVEDVTLRIGGTRMGKTGSMIPHVRTAPGPIVVTSTRTDLMHATARQRQAKGRVLVFNPTGLGDVTSTVRWSPLAGCADYATAQRRAEDLIPSGAPHSEGERWDVQARGLLAVLLHAAALKAQANGSGSVRLIARWLAEPDDATLTDIQDALTLSADPRVLKTEVRAILGINDRTLTSITATLRPAIRWASEAVAAEVGDAPLTHPDFFDVAGFVRGRTLTADTLGDLDAELSRLTGTDQTGTDRPCAAHPSAGAGVGVDSLYLVGREGGCRALLGALTAEIAHQARMAAGQQSSGRLDPPLTLFLDEAALTCGPVPLHDWTADMGGRGVPIHITAQSLAQLRDCWGPDRANAILANTTALLIFGAIKSTDDLQQFSTLAGNRMRRLDEDDIRPVPVMSPADIQQLKRGWALLIMGGLRPVIGKPDSGWPHPVIVAVHKAASVVASATRSASRWVRDQYARSTGPGRADSDRRDRPAPDADRPAA